MSRSDSEQILPAVTNGRIRQSIVHWCFEKYWSVEETCRIARDLGCQIMDGDVIARIRQHRDYIGHYHTAGNPGRGELDDTHEINCRPIMEEIVRTGFQGFVAQEFIPTRDPLEGLMEAVRLCDV